VRRLLVAGLALAALGCSTPAPREICGNGLDDDHNGLTDCDDPDCAGQAACYWGPCDKCGKPCTTQPQCLAQGYSYDAPLPYCVAGKCEQRNTYVEVNLQFNTTAWQSLANPGSLALKFISKQAVDGSAVSCATVAAAAPGKTAAEAGQIEASGKFQELGFDVRKRANGTNFAPNFIVNLMKLGTGADYLIWVEAWGGGQDPDTKLPQGTRLGTACYESAALTAPIVPEDNCPSTTNDAGTCRRFELVLPAP
jgi:hypothetical protein